MQTCVPPLPCEPFVEWPELIEPSIFNSCEKVQKNKNLRIPTSSSSPLRALTHALTACTPSQPHPQHPAPHPPNQHPPHTCTVFNRHNTNNNVVPFFSLLKFKKRCGLSFVLLLSNSTSCKGKSAPQSRINQHRGDVCILA